MRYLTIILLIALLTPLAAHARNDWWADPVMYEAGNIEIDYVPGAVHQGAIAVRVAPAEAGHCKITLMWDYLSADDYRYVTATFPNAQPRDELYNPSIDIEVGSVDHGRAEKLGRKTIALDDAYVTFKIANDGYASRLSVGGKHSEFGCPVAFGRNAGSRVVLSADRAICCQRITSMHQCAATMRHSDIATEDELTAYLSHSTDSIEGIWTYLDRDIALQRAALGGKYTLAFVRNARGTYDIVYLSGAEVDREAWAPMMIKGELVPTPFARNFTLIWLDSQSMPLTDDNNAQLSDDLAIFTLRFPVYKSQLRLWRAPLP